MNRPLALFDIDKTMVNHMSFIPMLEAQAADGIVDADAAQLAITLDDEHAAGNLGHESYVAAILNVYAKGLEGQPAERVAEATQNYFAESDDFYPYVQPTIDLLRPTHEIVIVTSNTQFAAQAVARIFDAKYVRSSELAVQDQLLTGKVRYHLATRHQKVAAIFDLLEQSSFEGSFAFGDSESDIEILRAVEHPVCINPSEGLRSVAEEQGWHIVDSTDELTSKVGLSVVELAQKNQQ